MIGNIFNVFSRRKENQAAVRKPLTPGFKQRTLILRRDAGGGSLFVALEHLHGKLTYLVGRVSLSQRQGLSPHEDTLQFLTTCSDAHFLDAVEYILQADAHMCLGGRQEGVMTRLNEFLLGRLGVWWAVITSHSLVDVGRDVVMEVLNFCRMVVRFDALCRNV